MTYVGNMTVRDSLLHGTCANQECFVDRACARIAQEPHVLVLHKRAV